MFVPSFVHREARTIHECRQHPDYSRPLARTVERAITDCAAPRTLAHNVAVCYESVPEALADLSPPSSGTDLHNVSYGLSYVSEAVAALQQFREGQPVVQLAVVGCSASKHDVDGAVPARDLYRSSYWTCKERFGASVADDWRIISAKHALLDPDREIPHYDRSVEDLEAVPVESDRDRPDGEPVATLLDQWAVRVHDGLRKWVRRASGSSVAPRHVQVAVCLGQRYEEPLVERAVFELGDAVASDVAVRFPWRDANLGGIGDQMAWLNAEAEAGRQAQLGGRQAAVATDGGATGR
jgi:hypothetical protein